MVSSNFSLASEVETVAWMVVVVEVVSAAGFEDGVVAWITVVGIEVGAAG